MVGTEYYIELRMTKMIICRSIRFMYYCEELFVVKHKSAYGCGSAIFYDMGPKRVTQSCEFKYICDIRGILGILVTLHMCTSSDALHQLALTFAYIVAM